MEKKLSLFSRASGNLFEPKYVRGKPGSTSFIQSQNNNNYDYTNLANTNIASTSSFRYGDKEYLVSTQQVKTDYSRFENHTFFHSAVANVNESFDRIVNFYPFDKSRKEIEEYEDGLTGFEKWILDSFPKNIGYINFSGSAAGESLNNGTYVEVLDRSGAKINQISDRIDGAAVLDPLTGSFSIEMWINPSAIANDNQVIVQKRLSRSNNITLALSSSASTSSCDIYFGITSGSYNTFVTSSIEKGVFSHVTAMYDRKNDQKSKLLVNDNLTYSNSVIELGSINTNASSLFIGKGDDVLINDEEFVIQQTFSGSIDELRFYHKINTVENIKKNKYRTVYPDNIDLKKDLKLYYKFNEPSGSYDGKNIVLDSAGNSLHAYIENYDDIYTRLTGSSPVLTEDMDRSPVLFPDYEGVNLLNIDLLTSGALYDDFNPNLITKLVPTHYFDQGTNFRDYTTEIENIGSAFSTLSNKQPGKNKTELPSPQVLMKLLFTYAKFFDEVKIYTDAITSFRHTLYNDSDTTPDALLKEKAKLTNTYLPDLYRHANIEQFFEGIDLTNNKAKSIKTLNQIQKEVWRRYITEAPRNNLRRGTLDSIKSIFRNAGIEPDNIFNFREFGGSKEKSLEASKELKKDVFNFLSFTGSLGKTTTGNDAQGYPTDSEIPRIKSNFLSASRIQIGGPDISGSFVNKNSNRIHGISNVASDGLLTSGSFTYEGLYKWITGSGNSESLIRMHVTGTSVPSNTEGVVANLVAGNNNLSLYVREVSNPSTFDNTMSLVLSGVDVFDGDVWYVSFGKKDAHEFVDANSGSYFVRAAKQVNGDIINQYTTSSVRANYSNDVFKNIDQYNTSGAFLVVGSQSFGVAGRFLNDNDGANASPAASRISNFSGMIANARFFSKALTDTEWKTHAKNYKSYGVDNPFVNYSFTENTSGSYERLILRTDAKQATTASDSSGNFRLFDFSQNDFHFNGSNFKASSSVIKPVRVNYEILSDKYDINFSRDKVRIRSFQDSENLENSHYSTIAPVSEIKTSELTLDDNRFSIDMSVMKALNEHILLMISDFNFIEDLYGKPNAIFSDYYHDAAHARQIYFNNLLEKPDLQKYRSLFKWVDNTFSQAVYKMLPRNTNFLGINFIYESSVLERNRMGYLYDEIYMKSQQRDPTRGDIYLSQYVSKLRKY